MTCETPTIRPLRRTDFPALEELIRLAWYDDGNDSHNTHDEVGQTSGPDKHRAELRKATRLRNMHRLAANRHAGLPGPHHQSICGRT